MTGAPAAGKMILFEKIGIFVPLSTTHTAELLQNMPIFCVLPCVPARYGGGEAKCADYTSVWINPCMGCHKSTNACTHHVVAC